MPRLPSHLTKARIENINWMIEHGDCCSSAIATRLGLPVATLERFVARHAHEIDPRFKYEAVIPDGVGSTG